MKAARASGIIAIVITVITFILIATNQYTHLSKNARFVYIIAFVLIGVAVIAWVALRGGKGFYKAANEEEMRDAESKGEIWCTQEQVNEIGQVFDRYGNDEITDCPVCGTHLDKSCNYTFTTPVLVKKNIEGVYVSRNYSPEVEQAYQIVSEVHTFPDARRCYCPHCQWEAFSGHFESYDSGSAGNSSVGICTTFNMGRLYSKRIKPADKGTRTGTFNKK